jgi:GH18 family chitinase
VIHGFLVPELDGSVSETSNFALYRQSGIADRTHGAGRRILASVGGATQSANFPAIAADATKRGALVSSLLERVLSWGYDGVDVDWEFPSTSAQKAAFTLLLQEIYAAFKSASPDLVVTFGISTGYYLDYYDFAALRDASDFGIYFGYDWNNPANGPIVNGGTLTTAGGSLIQSSVKGALDFVFGRGYPADKLVLAIPFYSSSPASSWYAVRGAWLSGVQANGPYLPDAQYREVLLGGKWWTTPEAVTAKLDAVLQGSTSVLAGGAALRGVAFWEFGHEGGFTDLSDALRAWLESH